MFQAALSGAILFNPERQTDPIAVAAGFTVLLLPYSVVGPFAGALLDRWDRRAVLLLANLTRAALIVTTAAMLATGARDRVLLLFALATVGVSRFVLAGVSAALPHVVTRERLVPMNSVLTTVSSGCAAIGAGCSVTVIGIVGAGDAGSALAVLVSAAGSAAGALAAAGFAPQFLGPGDLSVGAGPRPHGVAVMAAIASGLRNGARAVWAVPGVTTAMTGIGAHRIVFGVNTMIMVLILRDTDAGSRMPGGLVGFGVAIVATAAGMLLAAAVAPVLIPRLGRSRTVTVAVTFAAVVQFTLVTTLVPGLLLLGAFLLGLAGQTIKLTGDAAMQIDIPDDRRGQVFALQDTVFNIAFVLALAVTAVSVPADGRSPSIAFAAGVVYLSALVAIAANTRRGRGMVARNLG
ncbi:MFS transporter [Skermania sp. ID1734]|nr:MFS transporter [Skermania sp. ID1734]